MPEASRAIFGTVSAPSQSANQIPRADKNEALPGSHCCWAIIFESLLLYRVDDVGGA